MPTARPPALRRKGGRGAARLLHPLLVLSAYLMGYALGTGLGYILDWTNRRTGTA